MTACGALATRVFSQEDIPQSKFYVGVTDGPYEAHLVEICGNSIKAHYLYTMPRLHKPLASAIGAGDAVASGTLMSWSGGSKQGTASAVAAFKYGLAVGSASCLTKANSVWDRADCDILHAGIEVTPQVV